VLISRTVAHNGILRPSHVSFILWYSSNWNSHRLHSESFPPKEKHNVGPFASMTITTTLVSVLRRFKYLAERSNVLDHHTTDVMNHNNLRCLKIRARRPRISNRDLR
jgi:hypothetical protein